MALHSRTFAKDPAFERCLTQDNAHITRGAHGEHVAKIQAVVMLLDGCTIDSGELKAQIYGSSTAAAVLAYKQKRKIINKAYQTQADDIVGKMTLQSLDDELMKLQVDYARDAASGHCTVECPTMP